MSNAALLQEVERVEEVSAAPQLAPAPQRQQAAVGEFDPHPLATVFVAMIVAFVGAAIFIGTIVACLALRHTGVMAP